MHVRIMAVGDIFLQARQPDQNPFTHVKDLFGQADIVFGNLEAPITDESVPSFEQVVSLKSSPKNIPFLKEAHFSVLNLAHNHARDFGNAGAADTIRHVGAAGIQHVGVGRTIEESLREAAVRVNGKNLAVIGFYRLGAGLSSDEIYVAGMESQLVRHRVSELSQTYDRVIVSLHWGIENVFYPSPEQQAFARRCIDDGAAVVIGHHPHYVQGVEEHKEGVIFYSLGNFNFWRFDTATRYYDRLSCIADIVFHENEITWTIKPVMIDEDYCPVPITSPDDTMRFNEHLDDVSRPLARGIDKWWWFGEIAAPYLTNGGRSFLIRIRRYGVGHVVPMLRWLTSIFVIKCYLGLIRRRLKMGR